MRILSSVLAVAVLLPVGLLAVELWRDADERRESATRELHGIDYARALTDVAMTVTGAQSAAVAERAVPVDDVTAALEAAAAVDERYGEQLRMRERWVDLREKVEAHTAMEHRTPRTAYDGYAEATDTILDLGDRLRSVSGLIRDVDEIVYYLQDSGVEELPEAMVAAGQLVDLVVMASDLPPGERAAENAEISVARVELVSPVRELEFNLQSALESTQSRSLDSAMISLLDRFVRATDALLAAVPADGRVAEVNVAQLEDIAVEFRAAAVELRDGLLEEMEILIGARADDLARTQLIAAVTAAVALLLVCGVLLSNLAAGRRAGVPPAPPASAGPAPGEDPASAAVGEVWAEQPDWERSGAR